MNKVIVKRGPAGHWYSSKVGQSFNVIGYDDSYEAYLVEVPGYAGRFIYKQDCEHLHDNVSATSGQYCDKCYCYAIDFASKKCINCDKTDSVVEEVIQMFRERSETGIRKYGTTLDRTDLDLKQWIQHALEEHMDAILYLRRILKELER